MGCPTVRNGRQRNPFFRTCRTSNREGQQWVGYCQTAYRPEIPKPAGPQATHDGHVGPGSLAPNLGRSRGRDIAAKVAAP